MSERQTAGDRLELWTVYRNPSDYPGKYVARKFLIEPIAPIATNDVLIANDLQEIRAMLPLGLHCIPRYAGDDPVIVEVWV